MRKFFSCIVKILSNIGATLLTILFFLGIAGITWLLAFLYYAISKFIILISAIQPLCSWITTEIADGIPIGSIVWFIICFAFSIFSLHLVFNDGSPDNSNSSYNNKSTTSNKNHHTSSGFYDGCGNWRTWESSYQDAQGNWRIPGSPFIDGQGKLRNPNEPWQDAEGNYYYPDKPFKDGKGYWRQ